MRLCVSGSRGWKDIKKLYSILDGYDFDVLIEGEARGVDILCKEYAILNDIKVEEYPADWNGPHGKAAGFIRNKQMLDVADKVILFWDGTSKGTKHMLELVLKHNIPYDLYIEECIYTAKNERAVPGLDIIRLSEDNILDITPTMLKEDVYSRLDIIGVTNIPRLLKGKVIVSHGLPSDEHGIGAIQAWFRDNHIEILHIERGGKIVNYAKDSVLDIATAKGYSPLHAMLIDNRLPKKRWSDIDGIMKPDFSMLKLLTPEDKEIKKGVDLISKHIKGKIVLVTDSDADGTDSAALGELYFRHYLDKEIIVIVNNRRFGNGVNHEMIRRILEIDDVDLVITADHGSSDDNRYKILKEKGIDILVTDHHKLPSTGRPVNIDAFINPQYDKSKLPNYISGCAVLYTVLLAHHRTITEEDKWCSRLLSFVGVTTISDQMDLSRPLNRLLYHLGITEIKKGIIPAWVAFETFTENKEWNVEKLGRGVIPYINAANRMGVAELAYEYLSSRSGSLAFEKLGKLHLLNNERKKKQKAIEREIDKKISDGMTEFSIVVSTSDTDADGVVGILAGNIGEKYKRVTFVFVETDSGIKGSGRAVAGNVDIEEIIQYTKRNSDIVLGGGGHAAAGGVHLKPGTLDVFHELMDKSIIEQTDRKLDFTIDIDLEVPIMYLTEDFLNVINELSPFGQGFKQPVFGVNGIIENMWKSKSSDMCKFTLNNDGYRIKVISFNDATIYNHENGDFISLAAYLGINTWSDTRELQLIVK